MAEENKQEEKVSEAQSKPPVEPSAQKETDNKAPVSESREYTIPLRKAWLKKASYRRAGRASKAIKQFVARHMKVPDRDISKVKIDQYLNQEIWFRGKAKPPAKIKVKVTKIGDLFKVELADLPEIYKFQKAKHEKIHAELDKKPAPVQEKPKEERTEEEKKEEKEKAKSSADVKAKQADVQAKAEKQAAKSLKQPKIQRKALQK